MANNKAKKKLPISILDFPEEITQDGLKIYSDFSLENHLAVLSQFLHGNAFLDNDSKIEIVESIRNFLSLKASKAKAGLLSLPKDNWSDEAVSKVAEEAYQYGLFDEFFAVPYPSPSTYSYTFIDLFAGIGGIRLPFTELGYKCVFSSEWDGPAQKTYFANFGEMPFGDITKIRSEKIPPHDILLAGFPCQAFSIMGKGLGFADTRGTMFFEIERILGYHHPKVILLENVKQLVTHDHGKTFKVIQEKLTNLGYHFKWKVLNALDFGLPQKRERVIIVGFLDQKLCDSFSFDFPKKHYDLNEVLEKDENVDPRLFASDSILNKRRERTQNKKIFYPSIWHENKAGNISVLPYACALRTGASYNYLLVNGVRRPSSRELLRFQGFPDKFQIAVSHGEIRRQTGNSVAVPMIRAIAQRINNILNHETA
ncbi:MAG: DNA (cytosine-5-)-methyltransferase [Bacteroidales bacterium]|nr:DNA (cytosine-5-)-methyltransferase [Bacteroidales bacterium]